MKSAIGKSLWRRLLWGLVVVGLSSVALPSVAKAGAYEFSFGFSFDKSNYTDGNFSWTRRWGTSVGYHFTERSEVELGFQDSYNRNKIDGVEDTTFHDRVISVNWVQSLLGKDYAVQPYLKAGLGQLIRDASGSYAGGGQPIPKVDQVTGILGAGVRIYVTRRFAIRAEATSYLAGGSIKSWKDNVSVQAGISWFF